MKIRLKPDIIEISTMTHEEVSSIIQAHRNARTIRWLFKLSVGEQDDLRRLYAGAIGCPLDEVIWEEGLLGNDELKWLFEHCRGRIDGM